jgi:shikimate kinase
MGYYFIDLDQEIEDRQKKTISEIFRDDGEKYFRDIEEKLIEEILFRDENIVLSLGGGAFINDNARKLLKEKAITIWLDAAIDEILYRVGGKASRPLLNSGDKRKTLEELAKKRYPIYAQADLKFDTTCENHESLLGKIIKIINHE